MNFKIMGLGAAIATLAASPAAASTIVAANCISVADAAGCLFQGNINGNPNGANGYLTAQNQYNALRDPDITLNFLAASDAANFGDFGSLTGGGSTSGTWTLNGYNIEYIAVKAGTHFALYQVGGSTGSWDTFDLPGIPNGPNQGKPQNLSHILFFGSVAVPEPSAWALMILGFGAAGAAMRRRKLAVRFA